MHAGELDAASPHEIVERQAYGPAHEPVDGKGPIVRGEVGHAKMAEHDGVLGARHTVEQLVRL